MYDIFSFFSVTARSCAQKKKKEANKHRKRQRDESKRVDDEVSGGVSFFFLVLTEALGGRSSCLAISFRNYSLQLFAPFVSAAPAYAAN